MLIQWHTRSWIMGELWRVKTEKIGSIVNITWDCTSFTFMRCTDHDPDLLFFCVSSVDSLFFCGKYIPHVNYLSLNTQCARKALNTQIVYWFLLTLASKLLPRSPSDKIIIKCIFQAQCCSQQCQCIQIQFRQKLPRDINLLLLSNCFTQLTTSNWNCSLLK